MMYDKCNEESINFKVTFTSVSCALELSLTLNEYIDNIIRGYKLLYAFRKVERRHRATNTETKYNTLDTS